MPASRAQQPFVFSSISQLPRDDANTSQVVFARVFVARDIQQGPEGLLLSADEREHQSPVE